MTGQIETQTDLREATSGQGSQQEIALHTQGTTSERMETSVDETVQGSLGKSRGMVVTPLEGTGTENRGSLPGTALAAASETLPVTSSTPMQAGATGLPLTTSSHDKAPVPRPTPFYPTVSSTPYLPQAEQINPSFRFGSFSMRTDPSFAPRPGPSNLLPSQFGGTPVAELGPFEWPELTPSGSSEGMPTSPFMPQDIQTSSNARRPSQISGAAAAQGLGSRYGSRRTSLAVSVGQAKEGLLQDPLRRTPIMLVSNPVPETGGITAGIAPTFASPTGFNGSRRGSTMSQVPLYIPGGGTQTDSSSSPLFPVQIAGPPSITASAPSLTSFGVRRPSVVHSTTVPQFPIGTPAVTLAREMREEEEGKRLHRLVKRAERISQSLASGATGAEVKEEGIMANAARIRRGSNPAAEQVTSSEAGKATSRSQRSPSFGPLARRSSITSPEMTAVNIRDRRRSSVTSLPSTACEGSALPLSIEIPPPSGFQHPPADGSSSGGSNTSSNGPTSSGSDGSGITTGQGLGGSRTSNSASKGAMDRRRPSLLLYTHQPPKEGPVPPSLAKVNLRRGSIVSSNTTIVSSTSASSPGRGQPLGTSSGPGGRRGSLVPPLGSLSTPFTEHGGSRGLSATGRADIGSSADPLRRLSLARGEGMLVSNYGGPDKLTTVSAAYLYNRRGSLGIGLGIGGSVITQRPPFGRQELLGPDEHESMRPGISPYQPDTGRRESRAFGSMSGGSTGSRGSLSSMGTIRDVLGGSQETIFTRRMSQEVGPGSPALDARLQEYMTSSARGRMSMPQIALRHSPNGAKYSRRDSEELLGGVGRTYGVLPGHVTASVLSEGATARAPNIPGSPRADASPKEGVDTSSSPQPRSRRFGSGHDTTLRDSAVATESRLGSLSSTVRPIGSRQAPPAILRTMRNDSSTTAGGSFSSGSSRLSLSSVHSMANSSASSQIQPSSSSSEGEKEEESSAIATLRRIRHSNSERRRSSRVSAPLLATVGEIVPARGSALSSGSGSDFQEDEEHEEDGTMTGKNGGAEQGSPMAHIQNAFSSFSFPSDSRR